MLDAHTDISTDNALVSRLPRLTVPYARLMRLDRPVGIALLLLPGWWGIVLAGGRVPHFWLLFLFGIGAVIMRGAGCVINDMMDRDLDVHVERTRTRPLASGEVALWQAAIFLGALLLIGFGVLLCLNRLTLILGLIALVPVALYPLMKRVTWWPQLFLGLTFNWGALMGWSAVTGSLSLAPVCLYVAGVFWTLGYDTIYAHQDKRDDALAGIKSTALLFDDQSRKWVSGFYLLSLVFLFLAGFWAEEQNGFYAILIVAAAQAFYQLVLWKPEDPANCLKRFKASADFGIIVFMAVLIGKWL